jgi:hypothetical protein
MHKDITVTKLSRLQKQILVYARRAMLAKDQKIEPREHLMMNIPAPQWLSDVLTKTMNRIFEFRKKRFGALGEKGIKREDCHPWLWFFEEMRFTEQAIKDAAKQARYPQEVELTKLYEVALSPTLLMALHLAHGRSKLGGLLYHAWPYYDRGWYFKLELKGTDGALTRSNLLDSGVIKEQDLSQVWFDTEPHYPINCTIPELLRDLFGFPVSGPIDGLAFSPEQIGKARYISAQAASRRACTRLAARGLVRQRAGQTTGFIFGLYDRSGIGLTEQGVSIANILIADEDINRAAA